MLENGCLRLLGVKLGAFAFEILGFGPADSDAGFHLSDQGYFCPAFR